MPTTKGSRGPYAKSAERRRKIIDVAVDVFAQQGFRGSSLRVIGERVGMTPAGVLHHFGTKDALLVEVLRRHEDLTPVADAEAGLEGHAASLLQMMEHKIAAPGLTHLFVTLSAEATDPAHPAHDYFVARYARTEQRFLEVLSSSRAAGELVDGIDIRALAHLAISVMDGLQLQWLLNKNVDMAGSFELFLASFLPRRCFHKAGGPDARAVDV